MSIITFDMHRCQLGDKDVLNWLKTRAHHVLPTRSLVHFYWCLQIESERIWKYQINRNQKWDEKVSLYYTKYCIMRDSQYIIVKGSIQQNDREIGSVSAANSDITNL